MRRIMIGDTHGRSFWKLIATKENWDELILIGDYFDTHEDVSGLVQIANFADICSFKRESDKKVVMLIGNHDCSYHPWTHFTYTSGYQRNIAPSITKILEDNNDLLQMAYSFEDVLCTHAGVSEIWMDIAKDAAGLEEELPKTAEGVASFVNEVWQNKPKLFGFNGVDPSGDDKYQTPIWIRPRSLLYGSGGIKKDIIQVAGHTRMREIDIKGILTQGRYFFIDTLGTSGEYLIWEDGTFKTGKI